MPQTQPKLHYRYGKTTLMLNTQRMMAAFVALLAALPASAQDWPKAKPITFTVAFAAGSSTDIVARTIGQKVSDALGQSVVIDNKPGAGGNIGTQLVKRAAPDGYNVLVVSVAVCRQPESLCKRRIRPAGATSRRALWAPARPTSSPSTRRCLSTTSGS